MESKNKMSGSHKSVEFSPKLQEHDLVDAEFYQTCVPDMTYNEFGGTLSLTQSINHQTCHSDAHTKLMT